ncbi:MAG: sulfatase-like hydrolase/transferase [Bacteroidota bacterium]|nr:sulfatase-like hydrolase/transferase [Bacteroidota bacterium]
MKKIKTSLAYILSVHILALIFMTSQRLVLLLTNLAQLQGVDSKFSFVFSALIRGVWFDNVIACYITALPLIILSAVGLFNLMNKWLLNTFNVFYIITYTIVFGVGIADTPYFNYFFKHLNASIFNWTEERGTAFDMILQEKSYYMYFLFFIVSVALFVYLINRISKRLLKNSQQNISGKSYFTYLPLSLVLISLCILGIRGRFGYNPIKSSQAYFCDNTFLNLLGVNPLYYFSRDIIENSESHYSVNKIVSEKQAVLLARKEYGLSGKTYKGSPITREVIAHGKAKKMNVVVILMESMSANLLDIKENGKEITPYLHQLINKSYYFDNFYSAGNHTNHGVLATLFGLPALFDQNIMKNVDIPLCEGLPNTLQKRGYRTMFFMSHESQYDNMNAFLRENGVEEVYAQENYPSSERVNSFGVADDFLFQYAFDKINQEAKDNKPFQSTILTISNHPPYIVPDKFKSVSNNPQYQIVAYADDAIRQFMEKAEKQPWFKNTLFVLLADHGKLVGSNSYELPLSYNHIPFILYSKAFTDAPKQFEQLGGQVDVFPTIMGLLNQSYENNTFGVDLFKTNRTCMFFSADNGLGCINKDYFYAYNLKSKMEGLYKYKSNNPENFVIQNRAKSKVLRTFSASMLQTASYMIKHHLIRNK